MIDLLKANQLLRNNDEIEAFEDALAEIDPEDSSLLPELYNIFIDQARVPQLMWQLLHLIESMDEEASLRALIQATPFLHQRAPNWCGILWSRTLNSSAARLRLRYEILPLLNEQTRAALASYLLPLFPATDLFTP